MRFTKFDKEKKALEYHRDSYLIPSFTDLSGRKIECAGYDESLEIIESSKCNNEFLSGEHLPKLDLNLKRIKTIKGKSIYIGKLTNNLSQFFFDALARVKSLMRIRSYDNVVFTLDESMPLYNGETMYEPVKTFFEAFNLDWDKIIFVDKPMKFSSLRIPINEVSKYNVPDKISLERVINRMTSFGFKHYPNIGETWNSKIYITSRNKPNNKHVCKNEEEIENYFISEGYSILDPYKTPFTQQLAIYDNALKIIALEDEVLFNYIYCKKDRELIVLSKGLESKSYEEKLLALNYQDDTKLKYILFENMTRFPDGSFIMSLEDIKTGIDSKLDDIDTTKPSLNKNNINYYHIVEFLDTQLEVDYLYFQIGNSKSINYSNGISHVVSRLLNISSEQLGSKKEACFYQKNTAKFFEDDADLAFEKEKIDLAYIDGPRRPKKLLRDFLDLEAHCKEDGKVLIPNILNDFNYQKNEPETLWKMAHLLNKLRPDLSLSFIDANPNGLVLISNLNPSFKQENSDKYEMLLSKVNKIKEKQFKKYRSSLSLVDSLKFINKEATLQES